MTDQPPDDDAPAPPPPTPISAKSMEEELAEWNEAAAKLPHTFWQINRDTSLFEEIDMFTGMVVSIAGDLKYHSRSAQFVEAEVDGRIVRVQTGVNYLDADLKKRWTFSDPLSDIICQYIVDGTPLTEIPNIKGMPTIGMIRSWMRTSPEFTEKIKMAKKFRAEKMRDEAVTLARNSVGVSKDDIPGRKLAVDTLRWAAEKDSPEEYGNKVEVTGTSTVTLKLETGIRRQSDLPPPSQTPSQKPPAQLDYEDEDKFIAEATPISKEDLLAHAGSKSDLDDEE